ncbi:hypothetical protein [Nocardia sp. CS682]|uniref:hypothetical protein n=1 Tax=Nocardia sp. CS682 TaxID=1047172 RepID=UPI0010755BE6|nr:hypothetical protein [Nocardia sp. CS682]QBS42443.1 hypothetical protein DMB37_22340 [Nocardia sp. CS682]
MIHEPNLDPEIEAVARRVMNGVDELKTVRLEVERMDVSAILSRPTVVTTEFMFELAAAPAASPELQAYGARVRSGECFWPAIELLAHPLPPEVIDLKNSPQFIWEWTPEPPPPPQPPPPPRTRRGDNTVGPSDWPDDFDEYPGHKSWLS